jgi:hypothetical protein
MLGLLRHRAGSKSLAQAPRQCVLAINCFNALPHLRHFPSLDSIYLH